MAISAQALQQAQARHAQYYFDQLQAASQQYQQHAQWRQRAIDTVRHNWAQIQQGFAWASARAEADEQALRLSGAYPRAAGDLLRSMLTQTERIEWLEAGVRASERLGQHAQAVDYLVMLAETYYAVSDLEHCRDIYKKAIRKAQTAGYRKGEASALLGLGQTTTLIPAEVDEARTLLGRAQSLYETLGDRLGEAKVSHTLGIIEERFGDLGEAHRLVTGALDTYRRLNETRDEAHALLRLGSITERQGAYPESLAHLHAGEAIARALSDENEIINALIRIGLVQDYSGDSAGSRVTFNEARAMAERNGHQRHLALAITNLGWLDKADDNLAGAIEHFSEALEINRTLGDRNRITVLLTNLVGTYLEMGETERVKPALNESLRTNLEIESQRNLTYCLICAAQLALLEGQTSESAVLLGHAMSHDQFPRLGLEVQQHTEAVQTALREKISAQDYESGWAEGMNAERDAVVTRALALCAVDDQSPVSL